MLLDAADKSIEVVLAVKPMVECPITTWYVDHIDTWGYPDSYDTATNGTTAVTVVAAPVLVPPATNIQRQVKMITVHNVDQSPIVVYTQLNHGGTIRIMNMTIVPVGDTLIYQNEIGFRLATGTGSFLCDVTDRAGRLLGRTAFYDVLINGVIDAAAESIEIDCSGLGSIGIHIVNSGGAWAGALEFDGTVDGTNWVQIRAVQFGGTLVGGTIVNGLFFAQAGGLLKFRVYATAWTSGACAVWLEGTTATNAITLANSLPIGSNTIGAVTVAILTPVIKGTIFNTAIADTVDFFLADITPTVTPTLFRIYIALTISGVLSIMRTNGGATVAENLNGGTALTANASYIFDVLVGAGDSINLQTSVDATILKCLIVEKDSMD